MEDITVPLGFIGAVLSVAAYAPQIVQIVREKRAGGISVPAWAAWLLSALLIVPHAFVTQDALFIVLQLLTVLSTALVLVLAMRYRG